MPRAGFAHLKCVTVCTAYGASLLTHDGGSSAAQARPLANKGKTIFKYVVKLRPTKRNGKVVGDAGASGKILVKALK
ncbi:unnamed protein product [Closterium sp. NIES-64]|nr:unnamed protein product [Closterium sp. NIES-64]